MIADHLSTLDESIDKAGLLLNSVPNLEIRTDLQSLHLQSFVLLTHSAIELYLESLSLEVAKMAVKRLKDENIISIALVSLISSGILAEATGRASKKIEALVTTDITLFAETAYSYFKNRVDSNHGINQKSLDALLIPIGVVPSDVDISTYNAMQTYAQKRGNIAHKFGAVQTTLTKSAILTELIVIKGGLRAYDEKARLALSTGMLA